MSNQVTIYEKTTVLLNKFLKHEVEIDTVLYGIVQQIETSVIGADEEPTDDDAAARNALRAEQRKWLDLDSDEARILPIALYLDDFRINTAKPSEDRITRLLSVEEVSQSIADVLVQAFLPQDMNSLPLGIQLFYNEQKRKIGSGA